MVQDGHQAKMAQDASKTAQDGLKTLQDGLKTAQDAPKTAQEGSRVFPGGSNSLICNVLSMILAFSPFPGFPKSPQEAPKRPA